MSPSTPIIKWVMYIYIIIYISARSSKRKAKEKRSRRQKQSKEHKKRKQRSQDLHSSVADCKSCILKAWAQSLVQDPQAYVFLVADTRKRLETNATSPTIPLGSPVSQRAWDEPFKGHNEFHGCRHTPSKH